MEMRVEDAYRKSLETVLEWIHRELNTNKTQVFFRTYSPVHFRSRPFNLLACFTFIFIWTYFWGFSIDFILRNIFK